MLRPDDPYNQGIGTPYLGDMNLGQVPVNNMQVAEVFNTPQSLMDIGAVKPGKVYGYNLTPQGEVLEDFRNSAFNMREKGPTSGANVQTQFNRMLGIPSSFKDVIENQEYIQDAIDKGFLKEESDWENQKSFADPDDLQASLDDDEYDFSGIEGQMAFLDPASIYALLKAGTSKKKIGEYLLKNQILKQTGKKIGPDLKRKIRQYYGEKFGGSGKFKNIATGSKDYGPYIKPPIKPYVAPIGPHVGPDTPSGGSVTPGSMGMSTVGGGDPFFNKGGRASYFDGGVLSLWPR